MRFAAGNFMWRPAEVGDRGRTAFSRPSLAFGNWRNKNGQLPEWEPANWRNKKWPTAGMQIGQLPEWNLRKREIKSGFSINKQKK